MSRSTAYLHAAASLDGYIADENDHVGPLHEWYFNSDHPLATDDHAEVHGGSPFRVSAASADYVRGMLSRLSVLVVGRHQFDLTNGWEGHPPTGVHVVVVSHRPRPADWHPEAPYHFATSIEEGMALPQELAGDREISLLLRLRYSSEMLDAFPNLAAYVSRGEARPAYLRAFAAQLAVVQARYASYNGFA